MIIYKSRAEAAKKAEEIRKEHSGAVIDERSITFCGINQNGEFEERTLKTLEVGYEKYDPHEGWMDCATIIIYRE